MHERKKNSFISILERVRADADVSKGEGGGRGKMKWIRGSNKFSSRIGHWTLIDQCICDIWGDQGPKQSFQRITFKTFKLKCKHKIEFSQISKDNLWLKSCSCIIKYMFVFCTLLGSICDVTWLISLAITDRNSVEAKYC